MSRPIPVVDTNVVVAGLLTAEQKSPVVQVLDGMLGAGFDFAMSQALLGEYRTVLLRPRLCRLHGLSVGEVEELLADIVQHAIVLQPPPTAAFTAPDPGDQFLWDLLGSRQDLFLITGDKRLLADPAWSGRVCSPREFVDDRKLR